MIARMDNLRQGAATRLLQNWAPALFTLLALLGAVGLPLQSLYSARGAHRAALENSLRADTLRTELEAFRVAGGEAIVSEMNRCTSELLPRDLSAIDIRAALQLIAGSSGLQLEALSVGEFAPATFATLDDSVGLSEISLSGTGGPASLSRILSGMQALGYPICIRSFQLDRLSPQDTRFEIHALLELFEAIPPQAAPESDDLPTEEE